MFLGASVFGTIDHFWNGEFFMLNANWFSDIILGATITLGITAVWGILALGHMLPSLAISSSIGIVEKK